MNYTRRKTAWGLAWESEFRNETFLCARDRQAWFCRRAEVPSTIDTLTSYEEKLYLFHVMPGSTTLFLCLNLRFLHLENIRMDERKVFLKINKSTYSIWLHSYLHKCTKQVYNILYVHQIYKIAVNILFIYNCYVQIYIFS